MHQLTSPKKEQSNRNWSHGYKVYSLLRLVKACSTDTENLKNIKCKYIWRMYIYLLYLSIFLH